MGHVLIQSWRVWMWIPPKLISMLLLFMLRRGPSPGFSERVVPKILINRAILVNVALAYNLKMLSKGPGTSLAE